MVLVLSLLIFNFMSPKNVNIDISGDTNLKSHSVVGFAEAQKGDCEADILALEMLNCILGNRHCHTDWECCLLSITLVLQPGIRANALTANHIHHKCVQRYSLVCSRHQLFSCQEQACLLPFTPSTSFPRHTNAFWDARVIDLRMILKMFLPCCRYSPELKKWMELGNSGMFRPEMLLPMGLPPDVRVIAFGLGLERWDLCPPPLQHLDTTLLSIVGPNPCGNSSALWQDLTSL